MFENDNNISIETIIDKILKDYNLKKGKLIHYLVKSSKIINSVQYPKKKFSLSALELEINETLIVKTSEIIFCCDVCEE